MTRQPELTPDDVKRLTEWYIRLKEQDFMCEYDHALIERITGKSLKAITE